MMGNTTAKKLLNEMELPVIAAPMFLISSPEMVIEACKSGVIGSFSLLNARTVDVLDEWMTRINGELEKAKSNEPERSISPWAVNLVVHRTNKRFEEDVRMIKKHKPPIVITSLGNPKEIAEIVHQYGGYVFSDVINITHAKKAAGAGVDGLVLVCNGAGGHAGTLNPMAFTAEVRQFWGGITILSGCVSRGEDILAAKVMGADLVFMGTRFISTTESLASAEYKEMLINSTIDDIIYTDAFSGVSANYLKPSIQRVGLDSDNLKKNGFVDFSELVQSVQSEIGTKIKAWRDIWGAGQGVGSVKEVQTVSILVEKLKQEYEQAIAVIGRKN